MAGESKMSGDEGAGVVEGRGWISLLKDIQERYYGAFADLGPGDLQQFKELIEEVEGFLDRLNDATTDFRLKLDDYGKVRADVAEFCRYYAKWLGIPLMERLKHEMNQVIEEAVT